MQENTLRKFRLAQIYHTIRTLGIPDRTRVQKTLYLLQEGLRVPLKYHFRMHLYGPYSEELETDIERLMLFGYIRSERVARESENRSWTVELLAVSDTPDSKWCTLSNKTNAALEHVARHFGGRELCELELAAVVRFTEELRSRPPRKPPSEEEVTAAVKAMKPGFTLEHIGRIYSELRALGMTQTENMKTA